MSAKSGKSLIPKEVYSDQLHPGLILGPPHKLRYEEIYDGEKVNVRW